MYAEYRVRVRDGRFITISGMIEDVDEAVAALQEYGRSRLTPVAADAEQRQALGDGEPAPLNTVS